jgi:hypothetical protein
MNWPNSVALVDNSTKHYVLQALRTGVEEPKIADTTGLDVDQVAAIRARLL